MQLAERIRNIRIAHKLTQNEVADKCGISQSAYGQIERRAGKASFETLDKIPKAIGVSTSFLIDIKSDLYDEKNKL